MRMVDNPPATLSRLLFCISSYYPLDLYNIELLIVSNTHYSSCMLKSESTFCSPRHQNNETTMTLKSPLSFSFNYLLKTSRVVQPAAHCIQWPVGTSRMINTFFPSQCNAEAQSSSHPLCSCPCLSFFSSCFHKSRFPSLHMKQNKQSKPPNPIKLGRKGYTVLQKRQSPVPIALNAHTPAPHSHAAAIGAGAGFAALTANVNFSFLSTAISRSSSPSRR